MVEKSAQNFETKAWLYLLFLLSMACILFLFFFDSHVDLGIVNKTGR